MVSFYFQWFFCLFHVLKLFTTVTMSNVTVHWFMSLFSRKDTLECRLNHVGEAIFEAGRRKLWICFVWEWKHLHSAWYAWLPHWGTFCFLLLFWSFFLPLSFCRSMAAVAAAVVSGTLSYYSGGTGRNMWSGSAAAVAQIPTLHMRETHTHRLEAERRARQCVRVFARACVAHSLALSLFLSLSLSVCLCEYLAWL